jgi:mannose-6-phosphate isomerase-like protein (cupin superfamily)
MAITAPSANVGTRVMSENDRVRVWDMVIPPGEHCEKHIHRLPYFYIVVEPGLIDFVDPDNPSDRRQVQFTLDQIGFREIAPEEPKVDNRLVNVGDRTHRAIVVELKPEPPGGYDRSKIATGAPHGGKTAPSENVGTRLMFSNDWVRIWDLSLAPGEQLAKHIHRVDNFFVIISGGLIRFQNPDDPSDHRDVQFEDDQVTFVNVPPEGKIDNRLTNIGTKHHRNFLIELLR